MDLGLEGKIALVGGASRGLGRATAQALADEGASVALYARSSEAVRRAAAEIEAEFGAPTLAVQADVTSSGDCERAVAATVGAFGGLDILVTNMGAPPYGTALPRSDEEWSAAWELLTLSVIRLCRLSVPHMRARGGGSVVNITTCGVHQLIPETALSDVARLATTGFAKFLAAELAPDNIRVNNVLPGWMATERAVERVRAKSKERDFSMEAIYEEEAAAVPLGRFGAPEELASVIAFLVSDRASYITGVNLRVDGGWALNPVF